MHLSSSKGPIDVFLCTDGGDSGSPIHNGLDVNGNRTAFLKVSQGKNSFAIKPLRALRYQNQLSFSVVIVFLILCIFRKSFWWHGWWCQGERQLQRLQLWFLCWQRTHVAPQFLLVLHPPAAGWIHSLRASVSCPALRRVHAGFGWWAGYKRSIRLLWFGHAGIGWPAQDMKLPG